MYSSTEMARQLLALAYARRVLGDLPGAREARAQAAVERAHAARTAR
jgi:hypothetical protein